MRVAHVSCYQDPAGRSPRGLLEAWPTLVDVPAATAAAGADVTVYQCAHEDAELDREGVRFVFVAEAGGRSWRPRGTWAAPLSRRLTRRIAADAPDVIHFNGLSFPRHVRFISRSTRSARMLVQDHADHPPPGWRRPLHRWGLDAADAVVFTAASQAAPFIATGTLRRDVRVFEVPESSSRFSPGDGAGARVSTGIHGDPCLLWLGHLDANKDPLCILEALALNAESLPDARLWMCYRSAPLLERVRERIARDPRLAGRVQLLGAQPHDRVELMLRAADFLVQGSHTEGSGYAVIEALACGTTPLVTDIPSFRTLTGGGRSGGLSAPGDPAAMARTWLEWASRDREALRAAALDHFRQRLSFAALGTALRDAYTELLRA